MTKNVFITGGLGQDSQILVKLLYKKKVNTNVFIKKKSKNLQKKINFIVNDLSNKKKIDRVFLKIKPDIVLHLTANNPSFNQKN